MDNAFAIVFPDQQSHFIGNRAPRIGMPEASAGQHGGDGLSLHRSPEERGKTAQGHATCVSSLAFQTGKSQAADRSSTSNRACRR
jgi:hypothetical protein